MGKVGVYRKAGLTFVGKVRANVCWEGQGCCLFGRSGLLFVGKVRTDICWEGQG